MAPAIALYGAASLLDARRWQDNMSRIIAASLMIIVPIFIGMATYFYSLFEYSAYNFFSSEFEPRVFRGTGYQTIY
jgi:hypothetical protein